MAARMAERNKGVPDAGYETSETEQFCFGSYSRSQTEALGPPLHRDMDALAVSQPLLGGH